MSHDLRCTCGHEHMRDADGADGGCASCDCQSWAEPRRAWRYCVSAVEGSMIDRLGPGDFIVEWSNRGRTASWSVTTTSGEVTGGYSGVYVDKGTIVGGIYEPANAPHGESLTP